MAEQLNLEGGAEELAPPTKQLKPGVHYGRFRGDSLPPMVSEETRRAAVVIIFGSEYSWHEDESVLWNWINAHADRYFEGDYNQARRMINDASDPIWGGANYKAIAQFIWYLA
jgi:alpha-amylase/alpha-mannosidase (GH57 family)